MSTRESPDELSRRGRTSGDVRAVLDRHRTELQGLPGVVGVALGLSDTGSEAIIVYLNDLLAVSGVPTTVEAVPVLTLVTGQIDAQ